MSSQARVHATISAVFALYYIDQTWNVPGTIGKNHEQDTVSTFKELTEQRRNKQKLIQLKS